jgi:small subunit ribosomal protein S19
MVSIMARSLKKGFWVHASIMKKIAEMQKSGDKKVVRVRDRASHIIPDMIGYTFAVHNGKDFVSVYVTEDMIGHRL